MRAPPVAQQVVTILVMLGLLAFVLLSKDRCASGVDKMFRGLDVGRDGGAALRSDGGAPQRSDGRSDGGAR